MKTPTKESTYSGGFNSGAKLFVLAECIGFRLFARYLGVTPLFLRSIWGSWRGSYSSFFSQFYYLESYTHNERSAKILITVSVRGY
jgi:hypothetical protein